MKKLIFGFLGILLFLVSCKRAFYEEYYKFNDNVWDYHDTAVFKVKVSELDTDNFNIFFNIRHHTLYPFKNLWLFVEIKGPEFIQNGDTLRVQETDTLNIYLADDDGLWKGEGLGDFWDYKYLFRKDVKFKMPGIYTFRITHGMREADKIPVMEFGLIIQKFNSNGQK